MKRSWLWIALLLSVGVNIGILATVGTARYRVKERFDQSRPEGPPPPFARMADHLKLEGETRDRFIEIQRELFATSRQHREKLEELRLEIRREVTSENPDPDRVESLLAESGQVNRDLDRAMVESVLATRHILTPEEQERFFRVLERMRSRGRRPGHPGGPDGPRRPGRERRDPPG